jgi:hypothetical protein
MSLILALIFSGIADYMIIQGIHNKSIAEIIGIIGGNIALFSKIQNEVGRLLIAICSRLKSSNKKSEIVKCDVIYPTIELSGLSTKTCIHESKSQPKIVLASKSDPGFELNIDESIDENRSELSIYL